MSKSIRQRLGPLKRRVKNQVEEAKAVVESTEEESLENCVKNLNKIHSKLRKNFETLQTLETQFTEIAKSDKEEAKKLDEDIEELMELILDADKTLATIEESIKEIKES